MNVSFSLLTRYIYLVVFLYVFLVHCVLDPWNVKYITRVCPQVRVVHDPLLVTLNIKKRKKITDTRKSHANRDENH